MVVKGIRNTILDSMEDGGDGLSLEERQRFCRQMVLPGMGEEGQKRLLDSRVLVIGMGGLGSPAAMYLAAAGVGVLGLADFDVVEEHNLHRQLLHGDETVGWRKLRSAMSRLKSLNAQCHVELHPDGVHIDNALDLFGQYDVVVDGSDNFPTRYLVNDAAVLCGRPVVHGSVFQYEGQVSVFHADAGPCYRCLFPEMPSPGEVPNCSEAGVLGALCGVVGSLQALEVIKLLAKLGEPAIGKLLVFDSLAMNHRVLRVKKDKACPVCGESPSIDTLEEDRYRSVCVEEYDEGDWDVFRVKKSLKTEKAPFLLDVRESIEVAIARIEGSIHVPMAEVPERLGALPRDRPIVVYCHHGFRSQQVVEFLRGHGFANAHNLPGGIALWSAKVDSTVPRY